ncbi:hypothetical protein NUW58_g6134 [Xylaria curta]|uniref:Uncharacterized protein n=1 Tax=Xylaria curta TaxID=42375 RepID=A0ACC1NZ02_9PEZI|nr:hypothetical protein NUW58_g6134 [Xylaria curta]
MAARAQYRGTPSWNARKLRAFLRRYHASLRQYRYFRLSKVRPQEVTTNPQPIESFYNTAFWGERFPGKYLTSSSTSFLSIGQQHHVRKVLGVALVESDPKVFSPWTGYLQQLVYHDQKDFYPMKERYNKRRYIDYGSRNLFGNFPGTPLDIGSQRILTSKQFHHIEDAYEILKASANNNDQRHQVLCIDQMLHHCRMQDIDLPRYVDFLRYVSPTPGESRKAKRRQDPEVDLPKKKQRSS